MKLRALTLENVRKFGGKRVTIDAIGDGITVICEANEFGKSTFFDAIHAVIFERHTASGRTIQSLRPHAGGGIRIAVDVDIDGTLYGIEKRFLTQKGATVTDRARGAVIARDGEAEDWISRHVGASDGGPAGLLWVRQGVLGLDPSDQRKSERDRLADTRRDLLSSVAGEIEQVTGGRTMDRILRRCQEDLDTIATGTRLSPRGAWKDVVDAERALRAELDQLDRHCADLSDALEDRRAVEAELARMDDPDERARRAADLAGARDAARSAESHAQKLAAAVADLNLATLRRTEAERAQQAFSQHVADVARMVAAVADAQDRQERAAQTLARARDSHDAVRVALRDAEQATRVLRDELARAERSDRVLRARDDAARLDALLAQVRAQSTAAAESRARIAANPATPDALAAVEAATADVARLRSVVAAGSVRMTVDYTGDVLLVRDGGPLPGGAPVVLEDGARIDVPGIATLRFNLPDGMSGAAGQAALATALQAEAAALATCNASTLADARSAAQRRQQDVTARTLADQMLSSLAPAGVPALEQALADARETIRGASDAPVRSTDRIVPDLEAAELLEADMRGRLAAASEAVATAREGVAAADTALASERDRQSRAADLAGDPATRPARLDALADAADAARAAEKDAETAALALQAVAPDVTTATANLKRAESAAENARKRREHLAERRADLSARIDTRAEEGVEERRDEVAGRLHAVTARVARFDAEVAALVRLRDTLTAARNDAREAYFEPVQEELRPLLRILHDDAGIDWEPDAILPGALRRGGETEAFDTLSGGTQEQIAILTRLAFARLFLRRGQHLPIILDDALVYSDDDRIVKMFTALNRIAQDQQIIVFSCRQRAFAGLGGDRPAIRVDSTG